jgi:hypothetical protein
MRLARSLRQAERLSRDLADARRVKGLRRRLPDSPLGDYVARLAPAPLRRHLRAQILAEHRRSTSRGRRIMGAGCGAAAGCP